MTYLFLCAGLVFILIVLKPRTSLGAQVQAQAQQNNTQYSTSTPYPTNTFIPSATIGYEETLIVAQSTADEARRINAVVTSEYEQRALEQMQMTAEYEQRVQEIYSWTVTAALTAIPLTQTQQSVINTQIPMQNNLAFAQLTATAQAPTQIAALIQAQESVQFVRLNKFVDMGGKLALIVFVLAVVWFMTKFPVQPKAEPVEVPTETVVMLKQDHGQGAFSLKRAVIPCSPEQLTELAELAVNGEKTFAINRLENNSRTLNRDVLYLVRKFLSDNGLAVDSGAGKIALNEQGENFLLSWFDSHQLPDNFDFAPSPPSPTANHAHDSHDYDGISPEGEHDSEFEPMQGSG